METSFSGDAPHSKPQPAKVQVRDLTVEWLRLPRLPESQRLNLRRLGVSFEKAEKAGGIRSCPCRIDGNVWTPSYNGEELAVVALWRNGEAPSIYHYVEAPEVTGMIAFDPRDGRRWYHLAGTVRTPLAWLTGPGGAL